MVIVSSLQMIFLESERNHLVEERLETLASTLIASGLSLSLIQNLESSDDLIHDILGEEKVDQIIRIYDMDGEVLAENFTSTELPLNFNPKERWETQQVKGRSVRVLNIRSEDLLLQVGMIVSPWLTSRFLFNSRSAIFALIVLLMLIFASYLSSRVLFKPIKQLTKDLEGLTRQLEGRMGQPMTEFVIGPEFSTLTGARVPSKDEFEQLCAQLKTFLDSLGNYARSFHAQSALLTHELKTPLTVLKNNLTEISLSKKPENIQAALQEVDHLTRMINRFLQWSVLTSTPAKPQEIYAVKVEELILKIVHDLNSVYGQRIELENKIPLRVLALPDHVQQLLNNLLENALRYSPEDKKVHVLMSEDSIEIIDQGRGIPEEVYKNLGSPFNRGLSGRKKDQGTGLGLAWVHALCEKYAWKLEIISSETGTKIKIHF